MIQTVLHERVLRHIERNYLPIICADNSYCIEIIILMFHFVGSKMLFANIWYVVTKGLEKTIA